MKQRHFSFQDLPFVDLTPQLRKMASKVQKAKYLLRFHESKFVVTVQRKFSSECGSELPDVSAYKSYKLFAFVYGKTPVNDQSNKLRRMK